MSEFLRYVPTETLENILKDANKEHLGEAQSLIRLELARRSFALSNGVYDAQDGTHGATEHHEDEQWIIKGLE